MKTKKYFKGVEDLDKDFDVAKTTKEFPQELPIIDFVSDNLQKEDTSRRDFLKAMGFSISAAALVASCEGPVKKAIPYISKPETITPGKASYYASSYFNGRDYASILVKTRDGRPIKVDGNPDSPITKGGSTAAIQASVIELYDTNRYKFAAKDGEEISYDTAHFDIKQALKSGKKTVLLTTSIISPSLMTLIEEFKAKYGAQHVIYDPITPSAMAEANEKSFGVKGIPTLKFENADVIVGFDADFLANWPNSIANTRGYTSKRKIDPAHPTMSKHYQVESYLSLTGSNADVRVPVKPSQVKEALYALYDELGGNISGVLTNDFGNGEIKRIAVALKDAGSKAMVVCGINDVDAQMVVNAINALLGSIGSTIDINRISTIGATTETKFEDVVSELNAGSIGQLFLYNVNPVFDLPNGKDFAEALSKVSTLVSFDSMPNETNSLANYRLPDHHYLESWGDLEPVKGSFSFVQPTIRPIFKTSSIGDSLLSLLDRETENFQDVIKDTWLTKLGSADAWHKALQSGVYHEEGVSPSIGSFAESGAASIAPFESSANTNGFEVVLYDEKLAGGKHAGNPYIQELPDPVSKVAWGNYAAVSPNTARENDWYRDRNETPGKWNNYKIRVTANGKSVELPVLVQPGMPDNTIGIPLGYGRQISGLAGVGIGENAYPLASMINGYFNYHGPAQVESLGLIKSRKLLTGGDFAIVQSQMHYSIDDDRNIVQEATLEDFKVNPEAGNYVRNLPGFKKMSEPSLYPDFEAPGHHWFMSVDLNSCTGCGACVVACNVENNVPVVGKKEVGLGREMHWLRIDRYFASNNPDDPKDMSNPSVVFMPMMCQHCDNAPCENVCPVNATNHSSEGLNQMAYNRCIGTRYCANNCPFKVRRFNWFDYWSADAWGKGNDYSHEPVNVAMREELPRMILNPDVTVRSRGVMEKCSFCAQRIQEYKLDAKLENRGLGANEVKTACQTACPADAIVFGDRKNPESDVHRLKQNSRNYYLLEELHVLPSVGYLTKITNTDTAPFDKLDEGHFAHATSNSHGEDAGHGEETGHGEEKEDNEH